MKDSLRSQFERLAMRLDELDATLADPTVGADMKRFRELTREHAEVDAPARSAAPTSDGLAPVRLQANRANTAYPCKPRPRQRP